MELFYLLFPPLLIPIPVPKLTEKIPVDFPLILDSWMYIFLMLVLLFHKM